MADYRHGAYGTVNVIGDRTTGDALSTIVYVGTAPVNLVENGSANVNKPILCRNMADARKYFGYSDDWDSFTLCEAMHAHFDVYGVGPLVLINVLDPGVHKEESGGSASPVPVNGAVSIANAELAVLDSFVVKSGGTTKVKGTDYTIGYNYNTKSVVIRELTPGALGTTALTITWDIVDPSAVDSDDVIGEGDGNGNNTGIFAIRNVHQLTGYIPAYLAVPKFSGIPDVHNAMIDNSTKINSHWDVWCFADIPLEYSGSAITISTAATWQETNGYNKENESVYWPQAKGTDGKTYHLSVLAAAAFQNVLAENNGIPYKTASNTDAPIIESLYSGAASTAIYDDDIINRNLNKHGINSAAFVGGRWAIWGAHAAAYEYAPGVIDVNVAETNRMMLFYISNSFQQRRAADVDKPATLNDIRSMVADEQARLDALMKIGALVSGTVTHDAIEEDSSDLVNGDYSFTFNVTTMPLIKSLTAYVNWTSEGYVTYYDSFVNE